MHSGRGGGGGGGEGQGVGTSYLSTGGGGGSRIESRGAVVIEPIDHNLLAVLLELM